MEGNRLPFRQLARAHFSTNYKANEGLGFITCKSFNKYGAKGVQGAIGKPLVAPEGAKSSALASIQCATCKNNETIDFVSNVNGSLFLFGKQAPVFLRP